MTDTERIIKRALSAAKDLGLSPGLSTVFLAESLQVAMKAIADARHLLTSGFVADGFKREADDVLLRAEVEIERMANE